MAKKKETSGSINVEELVVKEFGEILTDADHLSELRQQVINVSPNFDIALGGGIPEGSFVTISGKNGQGKSSLALHIASQAQKVESKFGPRKIYYFDIEGRIKYKDLVGNSKLDVSKEKFTLIQSKPGKILSGDEFIEIGEKLINGAPGCIFIFDSFSSICTRGRLEANIKDRYRDDASLLLSGFCKRISQVISINQCIIIGINHLIANQGHGMAQWIEASGNKIKYQADVRILGKYFEAWEDTDASIIGQKTYWKLEKSALGPPFGEIKSYIRYGYGFDDYMELIEMAVDASVIAKGGAWFSYKEQKFQGIEKMRNYVASNPEVYESLKEEVSSLYKITK